MEISHASGLSARSSPAAPVAIAPERSEAAPEPAAPAAAPALDEAAVAARAAEGWSVGPLVVEHARRAQVDVNSVWLKVEQARAAYQGPDSAA